MPVNLTGVGTALADPRSRLGLMLAGMLQRGPTQVRPPAIIPEEEEDDSIARNILRGALRQEGPKVPSEAENIAAFQRHFVQSYSPARQLLADFFGGLGAGLLGQKYKSLQERKWEEWQSQQAVRLEQQRMAQQAVQDQRQAATTVLNLVKGREDARRQTEIKNIEWAQDWEKDRQSLMKWAVERNIDLQKAKDLYEYRQASLGASSDPFYRIGLQQAEAELRMQGKSPADPANRLWVIERASQVGDERARARAKAKGTEVPKGFQNIKGTSPWGEEEYASRNPNTGQWLFRPVWWPPGDAVPNVPIESISRTVKAEAAIDNIRSAAKQVLTEPGAIGGFMRMLPTTLRGAFGTVSAAERRVRILFNAGMSQYILAMSGVATSGREEGRLKEGLPAFFEDPINFVPGALAFCNMMEAMNMRTAAGISPSDLDLDEFMGAYLTRLQGEMVAEKAAAQREDRPVDYKRFRDTMPTAVQMLKEVAKNKGIELLIDYRGRVRGIKR